MQECLVGEGFPVLELSASLLEFHTTHQNCKMCMFSLQSLRSPVSQSIQPSLPHPLRSLFMPVSLSQFQTGEVKKSCHASPRALQVSWGPARVRGALPVVPCLPCSNLDCAHLLVTWVLILRCSRIISWPVSKQFVYSSRDNCARTLEKMYHHWCAVLHPSVELYSTNTCWRHRV